MHTRFPVAERPGDAQSIIGYVTFKDIVAMLKLSPDIPSLRGILRQIPSLKENLPIAEAMERLLREHTHIALVRDHADVVKGMITLEDIVEEMIGDIQDEHDLLPHHCVRSGGGWVVGGGISLPKLKEITGIDLTTSDTPQNLSSWMIDRIGKPPEGGEVVTSNGVDGLVRKVRRQRVLEAALRMHGTPNTSS
jgi:putative hemolysin